LRPNLSFNVHSCYAAFGEHITNYRFGWWDYVDDDVGVSNPLMVNRFSEERISRVRPLTVDEILRMVARHPDAANERWFHFEYRSSTVRLPVAVCWMPQTGRIIIDYNASAEIWPQETGAANSFPPFGDWARLDDMLVDAFLSWPDAAAAMADAKGDQAGVFCYGGWSNSKWRHDLVACVWGDVQNDPSTEIFDSGSDAPDFGQTFIEARSYTGFRLQHERAVQMGATNSYAPVCSPPWRFNFATPNNLSEHVDKLGGSLNWASEADHLHLTPPTLINSKVPCMISDDGKRLLVGIEPEIAYAQFYRFEYCIPGLIDPMSVYVGHPHDSRHERNGRQFSCAKYAVLDDQIFPRTIAPDRFGMTDEIVGPGLSASINRDVADALLRWKGTLEPPR
jgi:hypothetical protein